MPNRKSASEPRRSRTVVTRGAISAELDIAPIRSATAVQDGSLVPPQSFNLAVRIGTEGRPVVRYPQQLKLHRALEKIAWTGEVDEFNEAARLSHSSVTDPILITTSGTILSGFGRWKVAVFDGRFEINCIEYLLNDDESLQFILTHHQIRRGWNDFVRIRLALTLRSSFRQKALDNMRSGGKYKGLANLPEVQRIDVRQEIAETAAVCPRNVGNVETILETAHPRLIEALQNGALRINRAMQLCKLPQAEQLEQFIRYSEERATNTVIRRCLAKPEKDEIGLDPNTILEALHSREKLRSGSVVLRIVRHKRTVILVGQDLLAEVDSQKELPLK